MSSAATDHALALCPPSSPGQQFSQLLAEGSDGPVAADPRTAAVFALARQVARGRATVLVTGPSGAGKEVLAQYLHRESPRASQPFLAINCAALPETMLEALLFGHERGAFTGAQASAPGLFRAADGGTLFLDELAELPLALQAKLLRAVELGEILPLGATAVTRVDVRVIAATNRNLRADVEAGRFRADLYWRLAVFPLHLPPLAERPGDILPLAALLLRRLGISRCPGDEVLQCLLQHSWPGNVRELGNVLERAAILAAGQPIERQHIQLQSPASPTPASPLAGPPAAPTLATALQRHEAMALRTALAETAGHRRAAAKKLGISERTLRYKLAALAGRPRRTLSSLEAVRA